jgi:hypothetical protein
MTIAVPGHELALNNGRAQPPARTDTIAQLTQWAESAHAAHSIATSLVETSFVPQQFRGKANEATAAILAGAEVGLSPMAALRAFDIIQGTAAPRALTLRAVVQSQGHEVRVVEATETRAIVEGRRRGERDWQRSTWTLDRAQKLALLGKDNWKKQPGAMLVARATSEVCRWIGSDAIAGIAYSSEELYDDGPVEATTPAPAPARTRTMRRTPPKTAPPPAPEPDLDEPPTPAAVDEPEPDGEQMVTQAQQRKMHALFREVGIDSSDREGRLRYVTETIGRQVDTSSDLTKAEASTVIDALESWAEATRPPTDEPDFDEPGGH